VIHKFTVVDNKGHVRKFRGRKTWYITSAPYSILYDDMRAKKGDRILVSAEKKDGLRGVLECTHYAPDWFSSGYGGGSGRLCNEALVEVFGAVPKTIYYEVERKRK